jgi:hypothetical protein
MKRFLIPATIVILLAVSSGLKAQCSICTKTAQQLGHKPAKALNSGIIYLMMAPLAIMGVVGYRWWRNNGQD